MTVDTAVSGEAPAALANPGASTHPAPRSVWVLGGVLGLLVVALFGQRFLELSAIWKDDPIKVPVLALMALNPNWGEDYEKYVAAVYGVVFLFVLAYVLIMATKLSRLRSIG